MRMSKRAVIDVLAMNALRGRLTALPHGISAADVLKEFWNIGGVKLPDAPAEIERMALQYSDGKARVSHIIVNTVEEDIHVGLLIDTPEYPATEDGVLDPDGFLTYQYIPTAPYLSELGYSFFEKRADKSIHRIG